MRAPITVLSPFVWFAKLLGTVCLAIVAMVWVVYEEIVDGDADLIPDPEGSNLSPSLAHSNVINLSDFRPGRNG